MDNVIPLPNAQSINSEIVVLEPRSFEEMAQVIQDLRGNKSVIINLNWMDPIEGQRSVDFVAGGTFAVDGHQERIGENIFLFTPSSVQVLTGHEAVRPPMQPSHSGFQQPRPVSWPSGYDDLMQAVDFR